MGSPSLTTKPPIQTTNRREADFMQFGLSGIVAWAACAASPSRPYVAGPLVPRRLGLKR